jgi:ribonuclease HI
MKYLDVHTDEVLPGPDPDRITYDDSGDFVNPEHKWYAVYKAGGKLVNHIYSSWPDCKAVTTGEGISIFKSFPGFPDAVDYLAKTVTKPGYEEAIINARKANVLPQTVLRTDAIRGFPLLGKDDPSEQKKNISGSVSAYIAGGYAGGVYSSGIYLKDKTATKHYGLAFDDSLNVLMKEKAGSMQAAVIALDWAIRKGKKTIYLQYDWDGIRKYGYGDWDAKGLQVNAYLQFFDKARQRIWIKCEEAKGQGAVIAARLAADALASGHIFRRG